MMTINISNLTTVAAVDSAIERAESRKGVLYSRKTSVHNQVVDSTALANELPARLNMLNIRLGGATSLATSLPAGAEQAYWANQVTELTDEKVKLEARIANNDSDTVQDKRAMEGEYAAGIEHWTQYIADLEAKRAQLVAAAA
jgi:hypothetical protein